MDLSDRGPAPDDAGPTPPPAPAPDVVPASVDLLPCPHSDSELVHKLAGLLLPALSTAAVDSTAGDPFNSPSSVASDLRRDLVDHLLSLSLTFIPQTLASLAVDPATPSPSSFLVALPDLNDPLDVVSHLLNLFSSPVAPSLPAAPSSPASPSRSYLTPVTTRSTPSPTTCPPSSPSTVANPSPTRSSRTASIVTASSSPTPASTSTRPTVTPYVL